MVICISLFLFIRSLIQKKEVSPAVVVFEKHKKNEIEVGNRFTFAMSPPSVCVRAAAAPFFFGLLHCMCTCAPRGEYVRAQDPTSRCTLLAVESTRARISCLGLPGFARSTQKLCTDGGALLRPRAAQFRRTSGLAIYIDQLRGSGSAISGMASLTVRSRRALRWRLQTSSK